MRQFLHFGCYSEFERSRKTLLSKWKSGFDFKQIPPIERRALMFLRISVIHLGNVLKHDIIARICVHVHLMNPLIFNKFYVAL